MYGDVIEADLEREYGRDLADLWRGRMTLRKFRVLLDGLPGDCNTARALAGISGPLAHWSMSDALLGRMVNEVAALRWEWGKAHIDPKKAHAYRKPPESVFPEPERATGTKASEVADRDDIPVVSPHRLGAWLNDDN